MRKCIECEKYENCTELCERVENYSNKDYISQREKTFPQVPNRSNSTKNLTLDNIAQHMRDVPQLVELSSYFTEEKVSFPFLSDLQNKCLHLFYFHGLSYTEIAMRVNRRVRHVKHCLYKAKDAIRGHIFKNERV